MADFVSGVEVLVIVGTSVVGAAAEPREVLNSEWAAFIAFEVAWASVERKFGMEYGPRLV